MKRTFVILLILTFFGGLFWLGCDKDISQISGPSTELQQANKIAAPGLDRAKGIQNRHTPDLMGIPGVVGTAISLGPDRAPAILVLTKAPGVAGIPRNLDGIPVIVKVTGEIKALPKPTSPPGKGKPDKGEEIDPKARFDRPVPIGVSTGHPNITAGTIGARVTDGSDVYALSNNHVFADENTALFEDNVLQPGPLDGGTDPADAVGTLFEYVPIKFDGSENFVDAAIALSSTKQLGNATPPDGYGVPKSLPAGVRINQKVIKYGRTTGQTKGKIYALNATVNVGYSTGTALFVNQIIIIPGGFSAGGDSGSLVVSADRTTKNQPVGLLFAGSSTVTVANPIDLVLNSFGVTIDGE